MPRLVIHCAYGGFGTFNLDCEHDHGPFDQEGHIYREGRCVMCGRAS